ncbi:ATP-binding cassette domain-containing protein [Salmonella enterica]|nr:ATP-binding cassette domain-containing protein [Salmonella enterica]ELX2839944.1 ATP-binding cassette domain-containing protein [Salmonella enterica]
MGENIVLNNYDAEFSSPAIDELLSQVGLSVDQHTRLGKQFGGDELSIGQWQRLAIARALYRKANLFIFDEFSSSLDPETEHRLFNNILALNTTVLAVTHRLGNIKEFDRIIVMFSGKVIENGNFTSLMNHRGKFLGNNLHLPILKNNKDGAGSPASFTSNKITTYYMSYTCYYFRSVQSISL